jgi:hypothetical protein
LIQQGGVKLKDVKNTAAGMETQPVREVVIHADKRRLGWVISV